LLEGVGNIGAAVGGRIEKDGVPVFGFARIDRSAGRCGWSGELNKKADGNRHCAGFSHSFKQI
jgi:hypothetical protein